ncbi:hypothetical protein, partial [Brevundimonas naejangsanensis]
ARFRAGLVLPQDPDDLLFRESRSFHSVRPFKGRTLAPRGGNSQGHVTPIATDEILTPFRHGLEMGRGSTAKCEAGLQCKFGPGREIVLEAAYFRGVQALNQQEGVEVELDRVDGDEPVGRT